MSQAAPEKNLRSPEILREEAADHAAVKAQRAAAAKRENERISEICRTLPNAPMFGPVYFVGVYDKNVTDATGKQVPDPEGRVQIKFLAPGGELMLTAEPEQIPVLPDGNKPTKSDRFLIAFTLTDKMQSVNKYNPSTQESSKGKSIGWLPETLLRWKLLPRETLSFD